MFNFFCNLAVTLFAGEWCHIDNADFVNSFISYLKAVPLFGLFNNSTEAFYNTAGAFNGCGSNWVSIPGLAMTIAVILSAICCISVFFLIVGSVKRLFNAFLGK